MNGEESFYDEEKVV